MTMYLISKNGVLIGRCVGGDGRGWRFLPNTSAHKASRKEWPSATKCIPRWAFNLSNELLTAEEWSVRRYAEPAA